MQKYFFMIVEFTVGNFLSFKENKTFSLVATNALKEHENDTESIYENTFLSPNNTKLLKSSIFYGAIGSGKSNLLSGFYFFRDFILTSYQKPPDDEISTILFALNSQKEKEPSFFEMVFFVENVRYRYGFEADKKQIHSEWLFELTSSREKTLFVREFQTFEKVFKEGKKSTKSTRKDALFLSTIAQDNGEIALKIRNFFKNNVSTISLTDTNLKSITDFTIQKMKSELYFKKQVIDFFKVIEIGVKDIEVKEQYFEIQNNKFTIDLTSKNYPPELMQNFINSLKALQQTNQEQPPTQIIGQTDIIEFYHAKHNENGEFIENVVIDFKLQSQGTQKLFALLGVWFDAIENNKTIIIDELDSSIHTLLTQELIKLVHLKKNKNAQFIFITHDTNLLKKEIFRRDQVWFAEKNHKTGETDLYSMVEYKDNFVRNDASFEKGYLEGRYGAIPYLGNINTFINDFLYDQKAVQTTK